MAYYPRGYEPLHQVTSWAKVRALVRAALRGETIPPYLVDGEHGNGILLSGTHRATANDVLERRGCGRLIPEESLDSLPAAVRDEILTWVDARPDEAQLIHERHHA